MSTKENQSNSQQFGINQIFVKDLSFEASKSMHEIHKDWEPKVDYQLNIEHKSLDQDYHEVSLISNVTVSVKDEKIFIVEINHAGLFLAKGFSDDQKDQLFKAVCPNILFPYSRQVIADTIVQGGFPALHLSPIDFDARYRSLKMEADIKQN
ncbi:MAG: protein-export chaperone SecB [Legionellales bacterium]|nr:protein-export chaperone SecB [Legionellales bacterium]|tara:strand:+ start:630 stop:1085 length:456 start_codon:yes stop_codon:yes gene_type:complete